MEKPKILLKSAPVPLYCIFSFSFGNRIEHYNKINPKFEKLKSVMTDLNKHKGIIDVFMKGNKFFSKENTCEILFMSRF
jgi:hypothetical protein